ncbi:hypothetical protein [Ascidiaceihabitans sp.]|uniref:hypothetical protein n=1 Tax=Ascidiaceihabitans sp. TaxID=1872644 RepID=UPI0032974BF5
MPFSLPRGRPKTTQALPYGATSQGRSKPSNHQCGSLVGVVDAPLEHVFFLGSVLVHYLVAAHTIYALFHLQYDALTAATTHTGFEGRVVKDKIV